MKTDYGLTSILTPSPHQLLYEIQLFAASSALPQACKVLHSIFASSPPSYRAQYLAACTNAPRIHRDIIFTKILRYPVCTKDVLEAYFRSERHPTKAPSVPPELPRRLFRALVRRPTRDWSDRDPPLPFLRYLYSCPHLAPNANSHDGYALTKAVLVGFIPLVRFLLDRGATPAWKGNLAITIAIHRKDLDLVRILVERKDTEKSSSGKEANGKRCRLEDRVKVTPEMLRIAVKCKAQDIVEYLTRGKGCIPDMQTLLLMG